MIPLIVVYKDFDEARLYLNKLCEEKKIASHDLVEIKPLKEEITIGQIRELKKDLSIGQKNLRMLVFYDFDKSSAETQNSLLKTLEEKNEKNLFVFLVKNPEKVLSTIKSRAIAKNISKFVLRKANPEIVQLIDYIKRAPTPGFLADKRLLITKKEQFVELIDNLLLVFEKELREGNVNPRLTIKIIKKILYFSSLLESNNLNPQLTLDNLLIFIWKSYNMK